MDNLSIYCDYNTKIPAIIKNNQKISTITVIALYVLGTAALNSIFTPLAAAVISGGALLATASLIYNILKKNPIAPESKPALIPQTAALVGDAAPVGEINHKLYDENRISKDLEAIIKKLETERNSDLAKFYNSLLHYSSECEQKYESRVSLFKWAFPHIEKMLEDGALSDDQCSKLHENLAFSNLFLADYPTFDGNAGSVNRLALLLASPPFRKMYFSSMEGECEVEDPSPAAEFIHRRKFSIASIEDLVAKGECFHYFLLGYDKKFIFTNEQIDAIFPITKCKNTFAQDWEALNRFLERLHDEVLARRIRDRFINRFLKTNGGKIEFNLTSEVRVIPYEWRELRNHNFTDINAVAFPTDQKELGTMLFELNADFFKGITSIVFVGNLENNRRNTDKIIALLQSNKIKRVFFMNMDNQAIDLVRFSPFFESQFEVNFIGTVQRFPTTIERLDLVVEHVDKIRLINPMAFRFLIQGKPRFDISKFNSEKWIAHYSYTPSYIGVPRVHEIWFSPKCNWESLINK